MKIVLYLGSTGLIGFPSKRCRMWGIEINDRFHGLQYVNQPIVPPDGLYELHELHAPVDGPVWIREWIW